MRAARLLLVEPAKLVTATEYLPAWSSATLARVNTALVAARRLAPLNCHWKPNGAAPAASTLKLAGEPAMTVWSCGCRRIPGGMGPRFVMLRTMNSTGLGNVLA